jgi:hypothetical protein
VFGGMLDALPHVTLPQPHDVIHDGFQFSLAYHFLSIGEKMPPATSHQSLRRQIAKFDVQASSNFSDPPVVRRLLK